MENSKRSQRKVKDKEGRWPRGEEEDKEEEEAEWGRRKNGGEEEGQEEEDAEVSITDEWGNQSQC